MPDLSDLSLSELFALSDEIGDRYLTPEEIEQRNRALLEVRVQLWSSPTPP